MTPAAQTVLSDFYSLCDAKIDAKDESTLNGLVVPLRDLSKNLFILWELLADRLVDLSGNTASVGSYGPGAYVIHKGRGYTIRLVMWLPIQSVGPQKVWEDQAFSYDYCHNHDFSILTVGWFGPGYETTVYEVSDQVARNGMPGMNVAPLSVRRLRLSAGEVFLYKKGVHVHFQHPPKSFSVSLNILVKDDELAQFEFDRDCTKILRVTAHPHSIATQAIRFAEALGTSRAAELVSIAAETSPSAIVRSQAAAVLGRVRSI
jgi:hypothetical protein